jgi:hypothetical protein
MMTSIFANTHWLSTFQGVKVSSPHKAGALTDLMNRAKLTDEQLGKLARRLFVRVPRKGLAEIETCDCTDGLHAEVKSEFEGD